MGPGTHLRLPGGAAAPWTGMWGGMRDAPCCPFALDICQETRAPGPPVMDIVSSLFLSLSLSLSFKRNKKRELPQSCLAL